IIVAANLVAAGHAVAARDDTLVLGYRLVASESEIAVGLVLDDVPPCCVRIVRSHEIPVPDDHGVAREQATAEGKPAVARERLSNIAVAPDVLDDAAVVEVAHGHVLDDLLDHLFGRRPTSAASANASGDGNGSGNRIRDEWRDGVDISAGNVGQAGAR